MKKICSLLAGIFIASTSYGATYNVDVQKFLGDYQEFANMIVQSYHGEVSDPLQAKILDISHPEIYGFLSAATQRQYQDDFLAMKYFENFEVDHKTTHFCFILYNNRQIKELDTYLNHSGFDYYSAVFYLASHEMGHCLAAHQRSLGHVESHTEPNDEEKIADMFAIGFFLSRGQDKNALRVIKNIRGLPSQDIHSNANALEKFYVLFKADNPTAHNTYELFNIVYGYYLKIKDSTDSLENIGK